MTTVYLAPGPFGAGGQFFTLGGLPLNAGLIYTYAAGGTTPQATYTTSAGNVQNANPIVLSADGRSAEIWLTSSTYRFDVKDALGNLIKTYDNLSGINSSLASLAASSGSSLVGDIDSGVGAVAETVQSVIRRLPLQPQRFMTSSQKADVAAYTGSIDVYTAIMEAHDALPSAGGEIFLPPGKYRCSTMPVLSKPIMLIGSAAGISSGKRPTILAPDAAVGGLSLTVDAQYSVLRDFYMLSGSTIAGTDDGITSKAHGIEISGVVVDNFGRYGLAEDTSSSGNCNDSRMRRVRAVNNRSHGFYLKGNNSNVNSLDACDATTNGGYGFYLDGCIQNGLFTCHAAGNTGGGFYDNGSSNQYYNPYVEPGTGYTVLFDTGSAYALWMAGGYSVPTITDNGFLTGIYRKFGWDKKLIVNDAGGPAASNRYSWNSGSFLAGYLALTNETTSTNLLTIDGSSTRLQMLINLQTTKRFQLATDALGTQTGSLFMGSGVPTDANGNDGDFYFRTGGSAGTCIYQRRAGAWVATGA